MSQDVQSELLAFCDDIKTRVIRGEAVGIVALVFNPDGEALSWTFAPTLTTALLVGNVDMLKDQIKRPKLRPISEKANKRIK